MVIACLFWPVTRAAWLQSCCHSATWNLMGSTHFALAWAGMYRWAQVATTIIDRNNDQQLKWFPMKLIYPICLFYNLFIFYHFSNFTFVIFWPTCTSWALSAILKVAIWVMWGYPHTQSALDSREQNGPCHPFPGRSDTISFGENVKSWILNHIYTWFYGPMFGCLYPCIGSHPPPLLLETWLCRSEVGPCLSSKATNGQWSWACCPMRQVHLTCFWWWIRHWAPISNPIQPQNINI